MPQLEFSDINLRELCPVIDRMERSGKSYSAKLLRDYVERYAIGNCEKADVDYFRSKYGYIRSSKTKKAIANPYTTPDVLSSAADKPLSAEAALPVEEEFSEMDVHPGGSVDPDKAIVEKFNNIFKYTSPNQIWYHFGKGKQREIYVTENIKKWAKQYDEKLYYKIRPHGSKKNLKICEVVFKYLQDNNLLESYK